jgi:hypothetical protein
VAGWGSIWPPAPVSATKRKGGRSPAKGNEIENGKVVSRNADGRRTPDRGKRRPDGSLCKPSIAKFSPESAARLTAGGGVGYTSGDSDAGSGVSRHAIRDPRHESIYPLRRGPGMSLHSPQR